MNFVKDNIPFAESKPAITHALQNTSSDIERLISEIKSHQIDITQNYQDWLHIGFALADEFKENGRDYFHQISQFHVEYDAHKCDQQYNHCLKSNGHGIHIATIFHLAKQAGIQIKKDIEFTQTNTTVKQHIEEKTKPLPSFSPIYELLPEFLKKVIHVSEDIQEKDLMLIGSLATLSVAFSNVYGTYSGNKVFSNLNLFVSAPASAGKGRLNHCRQLVKPIHDQLIQQRLDAMQQYEHELAEYNRLKKSNPEMDKPLKPPVHLLFMPANSSASGLFQLLNDNQGKGLIFETEGDTLANAFKADFSNFSDGFRKAFHHEPICLYRKTEKEHIELETPRLSTVLSGTPNQILNLINSAEDGLFSRFMFFSMDISPTWKNVFANPVKMGLDTYFSMLGDEIYHFISRLTHHTEISFELSEQQQRQFNTFFEEKSSQFYDLKGEIYVATIRRLGLIAFRIMMILSCIRAMEDDRIPFKLACHSNDFQTAIHITSVLIEHSRKIFNRLPHHEENQKIHLSKKEQFYEDLPSQFNRKDYLQLAKDLGIKDKTAESYISKFIKNNLLHRYEQNSYIKQQT